MAIDLLSPFKLNDTITLSNRVLMAPLTRCMADDDLVPTQDMVDYYARRADAGLIISEATIIRPDAQGYPNTPGLFTQQQIQGWKKVTDAVHKNGGKMFAQIWHVGRVAHPHFFDGEVLAPSAIAVEGSVPRMRELTYITPKAATIEDIQSLIADYAKAAKNAIEAGFDGVEIHGANGYLIDQFLHYAANTRDDQYGQTPENMSREDNRDQAIFDYLLAQLESRNLAYLHGGIFDDSTRFDSLQGKTTSEYLRAGYSKGTLVGVGSYSFESAKEAINDDKFDLIAIGRPFIANPDYISKMIRGEETLTYSDEMLTELK